MYYLVIDEASSVKMYWNGSSLTFKPEERRKYLTFLGVQKAKGTIVKKFNYLEGLIKIERN